jgi:hypothetical protein
MARFEHDVLGKFRGKVGGVVGSAWRGIKYVRAKGPSTRKNDSPAQIEQQAKFSVAARFVRRMNRLFKITYRTNTDRMTARNSAVGSILSNAIVGVYPDFSIDYSKVLISQGGLDNEPVTTLSITEAAGVLTWHWNFDPVLNAEGSDDRAILVAYCPALNRSLYQVFGPARSTNAATLNVSPFKGQSVVTWIAFITEDGSSLSESEFTGPINVTP